jgi:hypothetical protein
MSSAELISKLKALPARERERVIRAVLVGPKSGTGKHVGKLTPTRKAKWPDLSEMKRKVYGGREVPNMVLLEREEARY